MADEQGAENKNISDSDKLSEIGKVLADVSSRFDSVASRLDALEEGARSRARSGIMEDKGRKDSETEEDEEDEDDNKIEEAGQPKEPTVDSKRGRRDSEESFDSKRGRRDSEESFDSKRGRRDSEESFDSKRGRRDSEESFEKWAKEEAEEPEHRGDKARKDSKRADKEDDEEDCNDMRRDSEHERALDAALGEIASLRARIADIGTRVPAILSDSVREEFARIQEQADPAFQAFGDRAPAPMDGETTTNYQRRLAGRLQKNSPKWAGHRLSATADSAMLDTIASDIYADSIAAARRGVAVPAGELREIVTRSQAGHTRIEFEGDASSWMDSLAGHTMRATGRFHVPN